MPNKSEYLSTEVIDGITYVVDRRVAELQPDGTTIIRDPVTKAAWDTNGNKLPRGWVWSYLDLS